MFRRGVRALTRRGVALAAAEDAVQEAGVRAITHQVPFEDAEDLLRWIQTVSWRIVLDAQKRDRRLVYDVPEDPSAEDVGREVEVRLRVEHLAALMGALSAEDRATLTARPPALDRRTSTRLAVRRHRIRAQLLAVLNGVAAVLAVLRLRTRGARRAAAVALPIVVAAGAWTLVPFDEQLSRPLSPPGAQTPALAPESETAVSPGVMQPPARSGRGQSAGGGRPGLLVMQPLPGGTGRVWVEPKAPHEPFLCLVLLEGPRRCVDLPIQITG